MKTLMAALAVTALLSTPTFADTQHGPNYYNYIHHAAVDEHSNDNTALRSPVSHPSRRVRAPY